ncbi:MAG: hypothetical protein ACTFAK_03205 [Candidatus Electronema sp. VV]
MKSGAAVKNLSILPPHQVQFVASSSAAALAAGGVRQILERQRGEGTV